MQWKTLQNLVNIFNLTRKHASRKLYDITEGHIFCISLNAYSKYSSLVVAPVKRTIRIHGLRAANLKHRLIDSSCTWAVSWTSLHVLVRRLKSIRAASQTKRLASFSLHLCQVVPLNVWVEHSIASSWVQNETKHGCFGIYSEIE